MFLDRPAVQKALGESLVKPLSKAGAFVMTSARRSIRKRKANSKPGNPPSSHVGLLRDRIFFGYDSSKKTVVVGPQLLNSKTNPTIPEALEFGKVLRQSRNNRPRQYHKFPYMRPAMERELQKFPALFKDGIRARGG